MQKGTAAKGKLSSADAIRSAMRVKLNRPSRTMYMADDKIMDTASETLALKKNRHDKNIATNGILKSLPLLGY